MGFKPILENRVFLARFTLLKGQKTKTAGIFCLWVYNFEFSFGGSPHLYAPLVNCHKQNKKKLFFGTPYWSYLNLASSDDICLWLLWCEYPMLWLIPLLPLKSCLTSPNEAEQTKRRNNCKWSPILHFIMRGLIAQNLQAIADHCSKLVDFAIYCQ